MSSAKANESPVLACKLTPQELAVRKAEVLATIHKALLKSRELSNGYLYRFSDSNQMLDQLLDFIKSERQCCEFFSFTLTIDDEDSSIWLELTGPEGVKEFIKSELGL
jgi:hypothetical protein